MTEAEEVLILSPILKKHVIHFGLQSFECTSSLFNDCSIRMIVNDVVILLRGFIVQLAHSLDLAALLDVEMAEWILLVLAGVCSHYKISIT